jgi:hypothetical protein
LLTILTLTFTIFYAILTTRRQRGWHIALPALTKQNLKEFPWNTLP